MSQMENILQDQISLKDISSAVREMPAPRGFVIPDPLNGGVRPRYAKEVKALYLLMHWQMINEDEADLDESRGVSPSGLSMYAALMQHGKTHVAEVFFFNEKTQSYSGSHKCFSIEFPNNLYLAEYDDWLMNALANTVLGVEREQCLGHDFPVRG